MAHVVSNFNKKIRNSYYRNEPDRQRKKRKVSVFFSKENMAVINSVVDEAVNPAQPLPIELAHSRGRAGVYKGVIAMNYFIAVFLHAIRYLHVFGIMSMAIRA